MANIDKYYIALIDKVVDKFEVYKNEPEFDFESVKYAIVSAYYDKYIDLITGETYAYEFRNSLEIGSLLIDNEFTMVPINMIIKSKKQYMAKSKIIKLLRNHLLELNYELLDEYQKDIIDIFDNNKKDKEKVKILGCGLKILQYIEEE